VEVVRLATRIGAVAAVHARDARDGTPVAACAKDIVTAARRANCRCHHCFVAAPPRAHEVAREDDWNRARITVIPLEIPWATLVRSNELSLLRPRAARHRLALAAHAHAKLLSCSVAVFKFGGGSAGHNGIESIDKNIGKKYSRIRIGIGRPKINSTGAEHVLDNFSSDEKQNVEAITKNIIESISTLIKKDLDLFSSKVNQN